MMNLADPELELIDPTPNVHSMFLHFDKTFFWAKLSCRCIVRWSKRMYSCAGICSYEGRGGVCDIALSEPLLKLRPRKDLVETLLHEMIHAFLFITCQVQDRDGHGPNFQAHMHRINRAAGLNISIYHDFHDEVKLYQTHWWRCNGPCQARRPHFGIVRRSANRAPGPSDYWWHSHQRSCGGTFIKIKAPEKPEKQNKKPKVVKPNADITKYITNNNNKDVNNKNIVPNGKPKRVLKDSKNIPTKRKGGFENNNSINMPVTNKNVTFSPQAPFVFSGAGPEVKSVLETVRNVWANKQIGTNNSRPKTSNNNELSKQINKGPSIPVNNGPSTPVKKRPTTLVNNGSSTPVNTNKHKADNPTATPPSKMKKIEEYFTATATTMLKDLYGQDFNITVSKHDQKFVAQPNEDSLVDCPVCNKKINSCVINAHLDECLNRIVIDHLTKPTIPLMVPVNTPNGTIKVLNKSILGNNITNTNKLSNTNNGNGVNRKRPRTSLHESNLRKPVDLCSRKDNVTDKDKSKSDSFVAPTRPEVINSATEEWIDPFDRTIKAEPGCSNPDSSLGKECPCCGDKLNTSVDEHLDECLSFFNNDTTIPEEGASTSFANETIVIDDDDDEFDETSTWNATGTKLPCPSCLKMVEEIDMNTHLDVCLS